MLDSYSGVSTVIKNGSEEIALQIQRGVKQGDPLLPLIFNLVIEPLLMKLKKLCGLGITNKVTVSALAFVDNIILLGKTVSQARTLLETAESYLTQLCMRILANKCSAFNVVVKKDSWFLENPHLTLRNGEPIPYTDAEGSVKYLGMKLSPWFGTNIKDIHNNLSSVINRVKKLALKPQLI